MQNPGNIIPVSASVLLDDTLVKATGTLTSNNTNVTNNKKITVGTQQYVFKTTITAKVRATAVLTSDGTNFANNETITIAGKVYTMKTNLTATHLRKRTPNEIKIGASAAVSLDNIKSAVNHETGEGTLYSYGTVAHTLVTATTNTDTVQTFQAIVYGTAGNAYASTETCGHAAFAAATFQSGVNGVPNEVKIGADANATLANLKLAFEHGATEGTNYGWGTVANTDVTLGAVNTSNHTILFTAVAGGLAGNITSTTDEITLSWTGSTLTGGGGTVGVYTITKGGGLARHFITTAPQFTGTPTYTMAIKNAAGDQVYITGALNENARTQTDVELMLGDGDQLVFTTNATVEDNLPIVLHIR